MLAADESAGYPEGTELSADQPVPIEQGALFSGLTLSTDGPCQLSADQPSTAAQSAQSVAAASSADEPAAQVSTAAADEPAHAVPASSMDEPDATSRVAQVSTAVADVPALAVPALSMDEPDATSRVAQVSTTEADEPAHAVPASSMDEPDATSRVAHASTAVADEPSHAVPSSDESVSAIRETQPSVAASSADDAAPALQGSQPSVASAMIDEPVPVLQVAQSLTAAPIASLSRVALQETFAELAASARSTATASSVALRRLKNGAERSLGIEVSIEDPALRDLFGHLVQVEALLDQLKQQAASVCNGAALLAESQSKVAWSPCMEQGKLEQTRKAASSSLSEKLAILSPDLVLDGTGVQLQQNLDEASWTTLSLSPNAGEQGSARYRLERRLQEEVLDDVEAQLTRHDDLRDRIRQRQCWQDQVAKCQMDILAIKRGVSSWSSMVSNIGGNLASRPAASATPQTGQDAGLRPQGPGAASGRIEALNEQLTEAQAKVSSIDAEVLAELLELQAEARGIVARPWAAFARIRTEFFHGMASGWAPMATELEATGPGVRSSQAQSA